MSHLVSMVGSCGFIWMLCDEALYYFFDFARVAVQSCNNGAFFFSPSCDIVFFEEVTQPNSGHRQTILAAVSTSLSSKRVAGTGMTLCASGPPQIFGTKACHFKPPSGTAVEGFHFNKLQYHFSSMCSSSFNMSVYAAMPHAFPLVLDLSRKMLVRLFLHSKHSTVAICECDFVYMIRRPNMVQEVGWCQFKHCDIAPCSWYFSSVFRLNLVQFIEQVSCITIEKEGVIWSLPK